MAALIFFVTLAGSALFGVLAGLARRQSAAVLLKGVAWVGLGLTVGAAVGGPAGVGLALLFEGPAFSTLTQTFVILGLSLATGLGVGTALGLWKWNSAPRRTRAIAVPAVAAPLYVAALLVTPLLLDTPPSFFNAWPPLLASGVVGAAFFLVGLSALLAVPEAVARRTWLWVAAGVGAVALIALLTQVKLPGRSNFEPLFAAFRPRPPPPVRHLANEDRCPPLDCPIECPLGRDPDGCRTCQCGLQLEPTRPGTKGN